MAHNLENRNGKVSFVAKGEKAWHGLGTYVNEAMTSEEVIKIARLDYPVKKAEITATIPAIPILSDDVDLEQGISLRQPIDNYFATYREDTNDVLGVVRSRYEVIQNKDAFGFFDSIIDKDEACFETAGTLGVGEKIFVTCKLPNDLMIKGEPINQYLLLMNSHDGSSSLLCGFTNVRVVCQNTLNMALGSLGNKISIPHKLGAKEKLAEASRIMHIHSKYSDEVNMLLNTFADTKLSDEQMKGFIRMVMQVEKPKVNEEGGEIVSTRLNNLTDAIFDFAVGHHTQQTDSTLGTLYGGINAISGYYTHMKNYSTKEEQFKDIQLGRGNSKIMKAMAIAEKGLKTHNTLNDIFLYGNN